MTKAFTPVALVLTAAPALAGDLIDARVTFTIADNDIFKGPQVSGGGANNVGSPSLPNSQPSSDNRLFFDDFERRDAGFENLTNIVLYTHQPGYFAGLDTEAAIVTRMRLLDERDVKFSEDGSYLRLQYDVAGDHKLGLTAFPISGDRFRLGYSYDISWGGSEIFKNAKAVPAVRLELNHPHHYVFLGAKTSVVQIDQDDGTKEKDTVWGVLAGAGVDVVDELRLEAGAGYFYRGTFDKPELKIPDENTGRLRIAPWLGYGGSFQITYHVGLPIGTPIDFRLYKNDPLQREAFFRRETYNDELSFMLRSELSALGQPLQDPAVPSSTVNQTAIAGDLTGIVKWGKARMHALGVFRNLEFILYNVPSLAPFVDFPDGIKTAPEMFFSLGADYYLESILLTPGVIVGVQRPANTTGTINVGSNSPDSLGVQTFVIRDAGNIDILDPGDKVGLIFASKLTASLALSQAMAAVGELQYSYDPNRRTFEQDPNGIATRPALDPNIVGFNVMLQARF